MSEVKYLRDGRAPVPVKELTSQIMSKIKAKNTKPEIILRKSLYENNLQGYRLHKAKLPGRPDIIFTKHKIAIFVNGCFWHRCPYCNLSLPKVHTKFWEEKFRKNIERDNRKIKELKKLGWKPIIFWECQINKNVNRCTKRIIENIKEKKS